MRPSTIRHAIACRSEMAFRFAFARFPTVLLSLRGFWCTADPDPLPAPDVQLVGHDGVVTGA
ncbi:hypothetical protein MCOL_V219246 [Mycobacterium colombiense CECT 3035]|uniref:Uncharacterized protein n=1 Tax=Mycobacterium colombiense CECT 3035 TaxID=1041522 RepID=J4TDZ8_9MYCO|nr:hypothetical protein MCOL_V219246 [Mycobacterium colombiense CECT 3035]